MKPKILVTRKMTDEAENKLAENFDTTFNKNVILTEASAEASD